MRTIGEGIGAGISEAGAQPVAMAEMMVALRRVLGFA